MNKTIKKYEIETNTNITVVRERIDNLFKEDNHIFKGKFIGKITNDNFQGSTNYSNQIYINGKITQHKEKVIIKIRISDDSPNYSIIINTLLLVFFIVVITIIAANKSTDFFHYLIPTIIFLLAYIVLKVKMKVSNFLEPSLKDSIKIIAKAVNGSIKTTQKQ